MNTNKDNWPQWTDRLSFEAESKKIEGGIRLNGHVKKSTPSTPLVSYVTVVWNNEKYLRRTIESVQKQTYENVEHIILDGASTDNTLNIIQEYESTIDYFASEPDTGLYDALNKAIPLCRGDLICVLNSDDWLPNDAAELTVRAFKGNKNELVLGTAKVKTDKPEPIIWKPAHVNASSYFKVANCCHNAIYATKDTYIQSGKYDSTYKIAADFKWIMSCYDNASTFTYTDNILVNYSLGGLSSDVSKHIAESKRIIHERFTFLTDDEVDLLNYMYYPWRDHITATYSEDIDFNAELIRLRKKYHSNTQFLNALSDRLNITTANTNDVFNNKTQTIVVNALKKYPKLYILAKKVKNLLTR